MEAAAVNEMLQFDPVDVVEKLTGEDCRKNEGVGLAALGLQIFHSKSKAEILLSLDDTTFSNELSRYLRIVGELGFQPILTIPFIGTGFGETKEEKLFFFMHREYGILLVFDTFGGNKVNGGNFYYCWQATPGEDLSGVLSSGGQERKSGLPWPKYGEPEPESDDIYYAGHHDGREALSHHINQLLAKGTFLKPWPASKPFIWLLHYMDTKEKYSRDAINAERISMFPKWARDIIGL